MKRRRFLKLTGIGLAAVAAVPVISYSATSFDDIAVNLILNQYPYLKIQPEEAEKFVVAYYDRFFKDMDMRSVLKYKTKLKIHYFTNRTSSDSILIRNQAEDFLFASDFFTKGMDEKNPVKYIGLYNPYKMPCVNPFSHLYYPAEDIS